MNIFCNDSGKILGVNPEPIYQNSAGVNIIRFIGQFPTSAQVLMAYKLPNGDLLPPKMLAFVQEVEVAKVDGGKFGVWEGRIGASPKIDEETGQVVKDENGQVVYDLDYTITQYSGTATVQFYVYAKNGPLATEAYTFNIEKGVPMELPELGDTNDLKQLFTQILAVVTETRDNFNNLAIEVETLKSESGKAIPTTEKGQPNGVASLNAQGQVPSTQLPPLNYLPLTGGTIDGMLRVAGKITVDGYGSESGVSPNTTATTSIRRDGLVVDVIVADHPNYWGDYTLYSHSGIYQKVRNNVYEQKLPQGNGTLALQEIVDAKIKVLEQAITQAGIIYTADDVNVWNERITADGATVLDGSKAVLKKVVGSTVKCENLFNINGNILVDKRVSTSSGGIYNSAGYSVSDYTVINGLNAVAVSGTESGTGQFYYALYDSEKNYISGGGYADGKSIPIPENAYYLRIDFLSTATEVMVNSGTTPLPYQPYFTGLKNASFAGIESTGRNLLKVSDYTGTIAGVNITVKDNRLSIVGTATGYGVEAWLPLDSVIPTGTYTSNIEGILGTNVNGLYLSPADRDYENRIVLASTNTSQFTQTVAFDSKYLAIYIAAGRTVDCSFDLMLNAGNTALPITPYIEPVIFDFPNTELGKWDSIDFENQKVVRGSYTITLDGSEPWLFSGTRAIVNLSAIDAPKAGFFKGVIATNGFTDNFQFSGGDENKGLSMVMCMNQDIMTDVEAVKSFLQQNPMTICYEVHAPTETPFTDEQSASGNEYEVNDGGTERVKGNDNAEYGANNELTINYLYVEGL